MSHGADVEARLKEESELIAMYQIAPDTLVDAGFTPLLLACHVSGGSSCDEPSVLTIRTLIAVKADVNVVCGPFRVTPLCRAATNGVTEAVNLLLAAGALINQIDGYGNTSIMYACALNHGGVTDTLLAHSADLSVQEPGEGMTALLMACSNMHGSVEPLRKVRGCLTKHHQPCTISIISRAPSASSTVHHQHHQPCTITCACASVLREGRSRSSHQA